MNKVEFGKIGEEIACKYLIKSNYNLIDRNYYYKGGELDIIAFDNNTKELVFIEVKTRANNEYGLPAEAVNSKKINNIIKGIRKYIHIKKVENNYIRVDLLELYYSKNKFYINHIKQIIWSYMCNNCKLQYLLN